MSALALSRLREGAGVSGGREALAALSGALVALSFPKFGHGSVAFVALVPLFVAIHGAGPGRALRLGYLSGAVAGVGTLYWTALVVVQYGGLSLPVGLGVMGLLCLAVASFPALVGWMLGRWDQAFGAAALLAAPVAWVASEVLRAHTFFRFPWCLLGYSQHTHLPLLQLARYASVYGLSFLVALVSAALAYAVVEPRPERRRRAVAGAAAILLLAWAHGYWILARPLPESPTLRVGLVQANILQSDKWSPERLSENVERHVALSREAAARGARLVVWPESSLPGYYDRSARAAATVHGLARGEGIYVLFGNDDVEPGAEADRYFVGAKLLAPNGALALRYRKMRLVPFGEYVPLQPLLTLGGRVSARLVRNVADFSPGESAAVGELDGHRLSASICYEAIFPDLMRRFVRNGSELLVNVTNDAWYGRTSAPQQHFAMARFRAVETGRFLVRAANTGISAIVDARGRVLARTELFERTALVGEVVLLRGRTPYVRFGDALPWACLAASVVLTALTYRRA